MVYGTGRPKDGYLLTDGTRVPSVTEIIGKFRGAGALINWAHKLGVQGRNPKEEMEAAGRWGTAVHDTLEGLISKSPLLPPDAPGSAVKAAHEAFKKQSVQACLVGLSHVEVPMVSEAYRFGGTFDFLANNAICDWKTGKDIYVEYLVQMGAYKVLCDESGVQANRATIISIKKEGDSPNFVGTGEVVILNIGPETLAECSKAFLNLLEAYRSYEIINEALKQGKKAARPPRSTATKRRP